MTPIDFAKGLLAQLSTHGLSSFNVNNSEDKLGLLAVHDVIEDTVSNIKGNEAKSPRYRELLKIRNCLQPGIFNQFGGFCPSLFEAMTALRSQTKTKQGFPISAKDAPSVLNTYSSEDRAIVAAAAKAYMTTIKTKKVED